MFHLAYFCRRDFLSLRETAPDYSVQTTIRRWNEIWSEEQITHVRLILQRLTAVRIQNPDDAEDVVQDTMLTVTTKFPPEELRKGLLVWSMGVLRRKIGNYYRKAQRFSAFEEQTVDVRRSICREQAPDARVQYAELRVLVYRVLRGLPPREKQVLLMLLAGMPACRIAELLSTERYQNIINRLHRGRQKLQRELLKRGYGPVSRPGRRDPAET